MYDKSKFISLVKSFAKIWQLEISYHEDTTTFDRMHDEKNKILKSEVYPIISKVNLIQDYHLINSLNESLELFGCQLIVIRESIGLTNETQTLSIWF